ncbi:MAG: hypothetical protein RMK45_01490 [Armatimonadota bacterium]|nr:hypothetical protein [Armatimonadota bacterium]
MSSRKSAWWKALRVIILLAIVAGVIYWFWYLPMQVALPALTVEFVP